VLASVVERDLPAIGLRSSPGHDLLTRCACAIQAAGLRVIECRPARRQDVVECRPARRQDVVELGSSWAKRLGIPDRRPAWLLSAEKP
jgi:hypothetical protein